MTPAAEFFTVQDLAEMLQLSRKTVLRMVKRGELPCYHFGRAMRFRRTDVAQ